MKDDILEEIKKLRSIADIGLLYSKDEYDKDRYCELKEITLRLLHTITDHPIDEIRNSFPFVKDYPTVKVDVRGFLLSDDNKILLVKESADGKWSLPGGWADIGYSSKEVIVKEFKEETGLDVIPQTLLAIFDKKFHPHPPQAFYVYKIVIYCKAVSSELNKGFDVLDAQYFEIDKLPELSTNRIVKSQIQLLYNKVLNKDYEAYFD